MLRLMSAGTRILHVVQDTMYGIYVDERGELMGTLGWMAILATSLVMAHGLITGWLPGFINRIFIQMEMLA